MKSQVDGTCLSAHLRYMGFSDEAGWYFRLAWVGLAISPHFHFTDSGWPGVAQDSDYE